MSTRRYGTPPNMKMENLPAKKKLTKEERVALPPKKRGRPPKVKLSVEPPVKVEMPVYDKLDLLRKLAEEVYLELGAGHLESIYHKAMEFQLQDAGLKYESERQMEVLFKGRCCGLIRADVILEKECVLEFKISGKVEDAVQQARQYMKLQNLTYGFVILFPKNDGSKLQFVDARLPDAV